MVTAEQVNELLTNYTKKEFLEIINSQTDWVDYRSKVLISNMWIERLMECIIMKKLKNYEDISNWKFYKKQKALFDLGILDEYTNHELKILNRIRNVFAHEINPMDGKVSNLIELFKSNPKNYFKKTGNLFVDAKIDGLIAGMVDGFLTRYLVEAICEMQSNENKSTNSNGSLQ